MVIFAREDAIAGNETFRRAFASRTGPLSVVNPELYLNRLAMADRRAREVEALLKLPGTGGTFRSVAQPSGDFSITNLE
jgi:hypothetical protein